jgi:hypothetical protein
VDLLIRARPEAYDSTFEQLAGDIAVIREWASRISR